MTVKSVSAYGVGELDGLGAGALGLGEQRPFAGGDAGSLQDRRDVRQSECCGLVRAAIQERTYSMAGGNPAVGLRQDRDQPVAPGHHGP
jgi:hypothetical protein